MSVATPSRLAALTRLRCQIFQTTYNPQAVRTGAKYLKRKLQGPAITMYYPTRLSIPAIQRKFPELDLVDEDEVERVEDVAALKKRGKGAPKKARTKGALNSYLCFPWTLTSYFLCRGEPKVEEEAVRLCGRSKAPRVTPAIRLCQPHRSAPGDISIHLLREGDHYEGSYTTSTAVSYMSLNSSRPIACPPAAVYNESCLWLASFGYSSLSQWRS